MWKIELKKYKGTGILIFVQTNAAVCEADIYQRYLLLKRDNLKCWFETVYIIFKYPQVWPTPRFCRWLWIWVVYIWWLKLLKSLRSAAYREDCPKTNSQPVSRSPSSPVSFCGQSFSPRATKDCTSASKWLGSVLHWEVRPFGGVFYFQIRRGILVTSRMIGTIHHIFLALTGGFVYR